MILIILFLVAFILFLKLNSQQNLLKNSKNIDPPAVPGSFPFIGHLLALGPTPHLKLIDWAKTYGSIFTIYLGTQKTLIIDDPKLIKEIFSKPAFSGRADNEAFAYFSKGRNGIFMSEGKPWEAHRRFTLKHLRDFGFGKNYFENLIIGEVNCFLDTLKQNVGKPFVVHGAFNIPVVNALWILIGGESLSEVSEKLRKSLLDVFTAFNKLITTGAMFSPTIRRLFPALSGWKAFKSSADELADFYKSTMETHAETQDDKNPRDLIDTYISEIKKCDDMESPFYGTVGYENLRAVISDIFQAGSETTSSTLEWTLLYLTVFADVQDLLQREIDKIIGRLRKPCLADRPKMPYVEAVISEVLRKSSLAPLGGSHRTLVDTEIHGFFIPKGTEVIANLYSAHHNPKYWNDPNAFNPDRFLTADKLGITKKSEAFLPFQVGRRQCLGEQFAKDTLFLFVTSIFQKFRTIPDRSNPNLDLEPIPGFFLNPKLYSIGLMERKFYATM